MLYTFKNEATGELVDLPYSSDSVPRIGEEIQHEGQTLVRVFSGLINSEAVARVTHQYPFVSRSMPKGSVPDSCDKEGRPVIRSRAHEREVFARTGYRREE